MTHLPRDQAHWHSRGKPKSYSHQYSAPSIGKGRLEEIFTHSSSDSIRSQLFPSNEGSMNEPELVADRILQHGDWGKRISQVSVQAATSGYFTHLYPYSKAASRCGDSTTREGMRDRIGSNEPVPAPTANPEKPLLAPENMHLAPFSSLFLYRYGFGEGFT